MLQGLHKRNKLRRMLIVNARVIVVCNVFCKNYKMRKINEKVSNKHQTNISLLHI